MGGSRKRPKASDADWERATKDLSDALEAVRAFDVEAISAKMSEDAGEERMASMDSFRSAVKAAGGDGVDDKHLKVILARASKARHAEVTEAPVGEVIWLVRYYGMKKSGGATEKDREALGKTAAPRNPAYERYYKEQGVVPEDEWDAFLDALQKPLPMVFRFSPYRPYMAEVISEADTIVKESGGKFQWLEWYENGKMAVQCSNLDYHHDSMTAVRDWFKEQNTVGTGVFQEAVSMIPPMVLDPQPHHMVLDMCSAPGSKLLECVDIMGGKAMEMGVPITGAVLSNEIDKTKAIQVLPARVKRSHTTAVVVVRGDARTFPMLYERVDVDGKMTPRRLGLDRVLADVPCTGDGTGRKERSVFETWSPGHALTLHSTQLEILLNGLGLLAEGGELVYSTCSLNPIENEAVVAAALEKLQGEVELVSPALPPSLRVQPGMTSWRVPDERGRLYTSFAELEASYAKAAEQAASSSPTPPPRKRGRHDRGAPNKACLPSMFPPESKPVLSALPRSFRMLPHHNDTGGFFVAIFRKLRHRHTLPSPVLSRKLRDPTFGPRPITPTVPRPAEEQPEDTRDRSEPEREENVLSIIRDSQQYVPLQDSDEVWKEVGSWFGISGGPETFAPDKILGFTGDKVKDANRRIYLATEGVVRFLHSLVRGQRGVSLQITAAGSRMLAKIKGNYLEGRCDCHYRPTFEGAMQLSLRATKRIMKLPPKELHTLLSTAALPTCELLGKGEVVPPMTDTDRWFGPCFVGLALPEGEEAGGWDKVWFTCVVLGGKLELNVEENERTGLAYRVARRFQLK